MIEELKSQITSLMREEGELVYELEEREKELKEYRTYQTNPQLDKKWIYFNEDYSKLSKIFNKQKYTKELDQLNNEIKENYHNKCNDLELRISEIKERITIIKKEIAEKVNYLKQMDDNYSDEKNKGMSR